MGMSVIATSCGTMAYDNALAARQSEKRPIGMVKATDKRFCQKPMKSPVACGLRAKRFSGGTESDRYILILLGTFRGRMYQLYRRQSVLLRPKVQSKIRGD